MSIEPQFPTHVRQAVVSLHSAHLALLRAAQLHDEDAVAAILRHAVQATQTAREHLEDLQYVSRVSHTCPVSG